MSGYARQNVSVTPISQPMSQTITGWNNRIIATTAASSGTIYMVQDQTGQHSWVPEHDQVSYPIEDACDEDGEFHERRVCVRCPHCVYPNYPFRKKRKPICLETGESWVGIEYKEPYAHYSVECSYCHETFYLRLHG
jgi:hypothetical protein